MIVLDTTEREYPRVATYLERLRSRPSYRAISPGTSLADSADFLRRVLR